MALAQINQQGQTRKPSKLENAVKVFDIGAGIAGMATNLNDLSKKKTVTTQDKPKVGY